ncbi:MAG: hypothetical protein AAF799_35490 [Myxococcota bacterium]
MKRQTLLIASLVALGCPSDDTAGTADTTDGSTTDAGSTTNEDSTTGNVETTEDSTSIGSVDSSSGSTTDDEECDGEQLVCDGDCIDPLTDAEFCGASGDCEGDNAGTACERGAECIDGDCVDGAQGWGTEEIIDAGGSSFYPRIAMNALGQAIVVFEEEGPPVSNGLANRFDPDASSWSGAEPFELDDMGDVSDPEVAIDPAGNAVAVWARNDGPNPSQARAARWDEAMQTWSDAAQLAAHTSELDTGVLIDADGNATAVYRQQGGATSTAFARRFEAGGKGWDAPTDLGSIFPADLPQLAVDPDGNVTTAWTRIAGGPTLATRRWDAATSSWADEALMDMAASADARTARLTADAQGNVFAVWQSFGDDHIMANRWDADDESWGTSEIISDPTQTIAAFPEVATDAAGNAIAVWHHRESSNKDPAHVYASRWDAGSETWSAAEPVDGEEVATAAPDVAMDPAGNALVVWIARDAAGALNVGGARWDSATGAWDDPETIEDTPGDVYVNTELDPGPQVAMDDAGRGLVVWSQDVDGTLRVLANRYE